MSLRAAGRKGVAIISALGVFIILGALSSVFSSHMKLMSAYSLKDARQLKAHYLAVAGVQDAISRLQADPSEVDSFSDIWWQGDSPELTPLGVGGYTLTVTDEAARINVATAPPQTLEAMLGGDKEAVAAIVKLRASGFLFSVEDLAGAGLSADAMSRVLALGTTLGDGKVNINTANADVIAALSGMDAEAARLIVEFRRGADGIDGTDDDHLFESGRGLARVPGLAKVRTAPAAQLIKANSNLFRVESVASTYRRNRIRSNKKISVVLRRDEDRNVRVISWEGS